jgi:ribosomal protein S18 acetylase RimI-like enzyme
MQVGVRTLQHMKREKRMLQFTSQSRLHIIAHYRARVDVSVGNLQARIFYTKAGFYPYWYSKNYMRHDDGIFYRRDF